MQIEVNLEKLREHKLFIASPMYGGMAHGLYTKSGNELSTLAGQWGLDFRHFYLFNESLIQRARNYIVDEFLRSDCTHLLFVDADIGYKAADVVTMLWLQINNPEYDVIAGPYPKKCLHESTEVLTEDGKMTISSIVDKKYSEKVLSLNSENKLVWSKITNYWKEPNKHNKKWVSVKTSGDESFIVTEDHEVAYKDTLDILEKIKYGQAKDLLGKYVIGLPYEFNSSISIFDIFGYREDSKRNKIISIDEYKCENNSWLYDIEVENTHNFFVNDGYLVHNCISWEKIKQAVDKGVADEDPGVLENFVGDYVFNPIANKNEIPLSEPVEVAETGTGFMMIRRETFEKYKEAYPQYSYLPDHVRSKNFDGSREIHAYFDCEIDPETKRYLSEDYLFCQNVRKTGMKVWLCPWIQLQHAGSYIFGGSLAALASINAPATVDMAKITKK